MTSTVLADKIVLVTGGNRGLGRAIVEAAIHAGAGVVLTYRSHAEEAEEVVASAAARGGTAVALRLDTTDTAAFSDFVLDLRKALRASWDRSSLDVLVNNAGFAGPTVLGSTEESVIDQLFAVHFKGVYLLTQGIVAPNAGPSLLADGGRIVNLSTGLARFVTAPHAVYASMKGAVEVLTRYWAQELGSRGITVNTIAPGPVPTDFAGGYIRASDDVQTTMASMTALGRVASPEDIASAVMAVAGPAGEWVTAQRIEASGGFRL